MWRAAWVIVCVAAGCGGAPALRIDLVLETGTEWTATEIELDVSVDGRQIFDDRDLVKSGERARLPGDLVVLLPESAREVDVKVDATDENRRLSGTAHERVQPRKETRVRVVLLDESEKGASCMLVRTDGGWSRRVSCTNGYCTCEVVGAEVFRCTTSGNSCAWPVCCMGF